MYDSQSPDSIALDEEFARALQAQDNGLRRRKRSSPSSDASPYNRRLHAPSNRRSQKSRALPLAQSNTTDDDSDKHSTSSEDPEFRRLHDEGLDVDMVAASSVFSEKAYCQGCGRPLSDEVPGGVMASSTNEFSCSSCVALYGIPPAEQTAAAEYQACPNFRCTKPGCSLSFLFEHALADHTQRVHSSSSSS